MDPEKERQVFSLRAIGLFDTKLAPLASYNQEDDSFGHYGTNRHYQGDLEAYGIGELLTMGKPPARSGGLVAIERVRGTLKDLHGGFVLIHKALMEDGKTDISIVVVPGSGTGELAGISGKMEVNLDTDPHSYTFDYTLPDSSS